MVVSLADTYSCVRNTLTSFTASAVMGLMCIFAKDGAHICIHLSGKQAKLQRACPRRRRAACG